ncbi:MAG: type III pantothenate kinase [Prevotella sp.]|nr:type III pantothenate kinase [Prevotella sp.]
MNLTIDIGNTCTKLVAFEGDTLVEQLRMVNGDWGQIDAFCGKYHFDRGIYSTVVRLSDDTEQMLRSLPFPMIKLEPGVTPIPITNSYATPATLGADRLAAAVGAYLQNKGREVLIIDAGTCITYDFVTSSGEYVGGNISPGTAMRLKALNSFTSALPLVDGHGATPAMGDTTETAIRSGVMRGVGYEIEGYVRDFLKKYPRLCVCLTGGAHLDQPLAAYDCVFVDDYIVPRGLNLILMYNSGFEY